MTDTKLLLKELRNLERPIEHERVETEAAMRAALATCAWDAILCDWSLPSFSAVDALDILKSSELDIPFIIVSGTIGEEAAVEAMRAGASDYILKGRLTRLSAVVVREVRESHRRAQLFQRQQQDQRFFDLSLDLLCIVGFDGYFKRLNPAWEAALGWSVDELVAIPWLDLIHPDDRQATLDVAKAEGNVTEFENRYRCKDGSFRSLAWTVATVRAERVAYAAARDVSARRKLEEQLRQSQKMEAIGSLAGGIAHDFNNLLSIILGYTDLLSEQLRFGDPGRPDLEAISRAAARATDLTRQLLAFSRQQVLQPQILDVNQIVTGLEQMLRRVLRADVEFLIVPAQDLGRVLADPGQVEQVLMNLVVNARDAMPEGGKLVIKTANACLDGAYAALHPGTAAGRYVMCEVTDTGHGMDRSTLDRIFEPFFTTKEQGKGTGLGLSTVFGVVQQSGGHVAVQSELGKGTTFNVYLPQTDLTQPKISLVPPPASTTLHGSETVLLVEDEEHLRALSRTILSRNGYKVLEAPNGSEALIICEEYRAQIQLLLTDVVMPQMGGTQLAERILAKRPGLKVLYTSGYSDNLGTRHALGPGFAFLQKPATPEALLRRVRATLDS